LRYVAGFSCHTCPRLFPSKYRLRWSLLSTRTRRKLPSRLPCAREHRREAGQSLPTLI
jgi:hypothetical protein